jgi:hypothetical protein
MRNIFHEFFNPHCEHCKDERNESHVCQSCEILKSQLERLTFENSQLMNRILEKPTIETTKEPTMVTLPSRNVPWNVRRQMLEQEDREKAKLIREAPNAVSTEQLEKDLDFVSAERELKKEG